MVITRGQYSATGAVEVTIASPPGEAPRLDFSRFSTFGMQDDANKSALPRSKSSSHIFHSHVQEADDDDDMGSLDDGRFRARSECERSGMRDLIEFLRSTSPPAYNHMSSAFDDDADQTDEEPGKWRTLTKKLKMRLIKTNAASDEVQIKFKFTEPAVAARTAEGYPHMAISIPMEHCPLGPDSDWSMPAFNATKPLPPSPPRWPRKGSLPDAPWSNTSRHGGSLSTGEDGFVPLPAPKALPRMEYNDSQTSIRLWQHNNPFSPPESPPPSKTAPAAGHPATPVQAARVELPMDPDAYVELPLSPSSSAPRTPESNMKDRVRNINKTIMSTAQNLHSASGPPPGSSPHPVPYSTFHPSRPGSSPTKPLPRRPENVKLPARKSSLKNAAAVAASRTRNRPSLDEVLSNNRGRPCPEDTIEKAEPSPTSLSGQSIGSSILTEESEPVVASARAVRGYSNASIILQSTPGTTPRASIIRLSVDKKSSSPDSDAKVVTPTKVQRKPSTRMSASRKSRAERVKSLKQRDMEVARARMQMRQLDGENQVDSDARPATTETVISTLRLPSREGLANTSSVSSFAEFFPRPPTAEDMGGSQRPDSILNPSEVDPGTEDALNRDSYCSSRGPRRFNSYLRTSWASSIPLLDRISSYAPSETSFMQILDTAAPASNPHRRSDSATLPPFEQERLAPSRLSLVPSISGNVGDSNSSSPSRRQSTISRPAAPDSGLSARSSGCLPATIPRPCTPPEERWSATTTQSPETMAASSSPPTSLSNSSRNERMSAVPTPPASRRGSPDECATCGHGTSLDGSTLTTFQHRMEEDVRQSQVQRVGHIHHGIWSPASMHDIDVHMSESIEHLGDDIPQHYESVLQQRGSHVLLRMSSAELRAHYDGLHRSGRQSDVAHHILLNQERMEFELRRQEHNQQISYARLVQNQMMFFSELERTVEGLAKKLSTQGRPPRASLGWDGLMAAETGTSQLDRHEANWHDTATTAVDLEAMDPLMRDLHAASRVSHESSRNQLRETTEGSASTAAVGGHELDAYFNMI